MLTSVVLYRSNHVGQCLVFQNRTTRGTIWITTGEAVIIKKPYFSVKMHYGHLKDKSFFDCEILENSILDEPYFVEV